VLKFKNKFGTLRVNTLQLLDIMKSKHFHIEVAVNMEITEPILCYLGNMNLLQPISLMGWGARGANVKP
jgi:hypothetical protein